MQAQEGDHRLTDTTTFPFRSIVRIVDKIGSSFYQASGVLISPDEVLTASHVVYTAGVGTATSITVQPGYSGGSAPFGTITGTVTHYNAINDAGGLVLLSDIPRDYALIHLSSPVSVGYMSLGADFSGGAVTVGGYPGTTGAQVDQSEQISTGLYNVLNGQSLGPGSSGGPLFTTDALGGASVVGIVSAGDSAGNGYFPKITTAVRSQLLTWAAQDDGIQLQAGYVDGKTGASGQAALTAAVGGPSYLDWTYIWSGTDSVSLATSVPNVFLKGGIGDDAIQVSSGSNVLDGGTGSNFLVGGTGTDTFYTDARATAVVWNTIQNFHQGDAATLWGFAGGVSSYFWEAKPTGADGYTGATLRANIVGGAGRNGNGIDASITFTGLSVSQAKALTITQSTPGATPYLLIYNQGV